MRTGCALVLAMVVLDLVEDRAQPSEGSAAVANADALLLLTLLLPQRAHGL